MRDDRTAAPHKARFCRPASRRRWAPLFLSVQILGAQALLTAASSNHGLTAAAYALEQPPAYTAEPASAPVKAHNAILFIGDGLGPSAITATRVHLSATQRRLAMDRMPVTGLLRTASATDMVTDSAAAATALAAGVKTYNGAIGVGPKTAGGGAGQPLTTILDLARRAGKSIGVVTTTRVTHATPAAFYAHVAERHDEAAIASDLSQAGLDLVLGGGRAYFYPTSWRDPLSQEHGRRKDKRNIVEELQQRGWDYISRPSELARLPLSRRPLLGLFDFSHLAYEQDAPHDNRQDALLVQMLRFAIERLSQNPNGYVLMVEGGRIDHAAHLNKARHLVAEVTAFDDSIALAQRLTADSATLIVATADHDTGGLALSGDLARELAHGEAIFGHDTGGKRRLLTFATGPGYQAKHWSNDAAERYFPSTYYLPRAAHTAVDVHLFASGPGAMMFSGSHENSEVAPLLATALGFRF